MLRAGPARFFVFLCCSSCFLVFSLFSIKMILKNIDFERRAGSTPTHSRISAIFGVKVNLTLAF